MTQFKEPELANFKVFGESIKWITQVKEPDCAIGQPIRRVSATWWHFVDISFLRQKFIFESACFIELQ
jgi:hypothetical protein